MADNVAPSKIMKLIFYVNGVLHYTWKSPRVGANFNFISRGSIVTPVGKEFKGLYE